MSFTHIIHIADIHIHSKINDKILYAWDELVCNIKLHKAYPKSIMVVIAGDVFEFKNKLFGKDIDVFNKIINDLHNMSVTTVIVPGNHDFNDESTDLVSSIMNNKKMDNILVLRNTSRYQVGNILFSVYSPVDDIMLQGDSITLDNIIKNNSEIEYNIAIAHEPLKGCVFDNGMITNDSRLTVEDFNNYDITILGDIHKTQFLTPTIAYCGSFVQKNRGEGLDHGYIEWDLQSKHGSFCRLTPWHNDVIIKVKNDEYYSLPDAVEPNRVVLEHQNCSPLYLEKIRESMIGLYNKIDNQLDIINHTIGEVDTRSSNGYMEGIFNDSSYTKEQQEIIISLHKSYMNDEQCNDRKLWKLCYLQWINIYKYKELSYIDFSACKGVSILNGINAIGKSSIINILIYILYGGKTGVTSALKRDFILNNSNNNNGAIECAINVDGDIYKIKRTIYRKGNHDKVILYKNDSIISNGDITMTYNIINNIIGNREDFLDISTALQGRNVFIDYTSKCKTEFLSRILGIDNLNILVTKNKTVISDNKKLIKEFNKISNDNTKELETQLDEYNMKLNNLQERIKQNKQEFDDITNLISNTNILINDSINVADYNSFNDELNTSSSKIKTLWHQYNNIIDPVDHSIEYSVDHSIEYSMDYITENLLSIDSSDYKKLLSIEMMINHISNTYNIKLSKQKYIPLSSTNLSQYILDIEKYISLIDCNKLLPYYDNDFTKLDLSMDELLDITKNPIEKPEGCIISYDESVIDDEYNTKYNEQEYRNKLSELLSYNKHNVPSENDIIDELNLLPPEDKYNIYSHIDASQERLDTINFDINRLNKMDNGILTTILSSDHPKVTIQQIDDINDQINELKSQIKKISDDDIEQLKSSIDDFNNKYRGLIYDEHCTHCCNNKKIINSITSMDILQENYDSLCKQRNDNNIKREECKILIKRKLNMITILKKQLCDECDVVKCSINYTKKCNRAIELNKMLVLARENTKVMEEISTCNKILHIITENNKLAQNKIYSSLFDKYTRYISAKNTINHILYHNNIVEINDKLNIYYNIVQHHIQIYDITNEIHSNIGKYNMLLKTIDQIKENIKLRSLLDENNIKKDKLQVKLDSLNDEKDTIVSSIGSVKGKYTSACDRDGKIMEYSDILSKAQLYDMFMNGKGGIVMRIIKNSSKDIETEWNKKLSNVVDFNIEISFEKDILNINICENNKMISADVASGFQKFILDLTFRETIYDIAQITIPSFLIIDEGFGSADESNRIMLKTYLQSLSSVYPFIFIISHIDDFKACADSTLIIESTNGYSHISYGNKPSTLTIEDNMVDVNTDSDSSVKKMSTRSINNIINSYISNIIKENPERLQNANKFTKVVNYQSNTEYHCIICDRYIKARPSAVKHCDTQKHKNHLIMKEYENEINELKEMNSNN